MTDDFDKQYFTESVKCFYFGDPDEESIPINWNNSSNPVSWPANIKLSDDSVLERRKMKKYALTKEE